MVNFAKFRTEVEGMPGDLVAVPKTQLFEMIDRAEAGQKAERMLGSIATIAGLGVGVARVAA